MKKSSEHPFKIVKLYKPTGEEHQKSFKDVLSLYEENFVPTNFLLSLLDVETILSGKPELRTVSSTTSQVLRSVFRIKR